uniref:Uncharacterized protein n=1 Tax=Arundo donax TaxID=35708 RepID=A0A0A9ER69_ARUDO
MCLDRISARHGLELADLVGASRIYSTMASSLTGCSGGVRGDESRLEVGSVVSLHVVVAAWRCPAMAISARGCRTYGRWVGGRLCLDRHILPRLRHRQATRGATGAGRSGCGAGGTIGEAANSVQQS